MKRPYPLLVVSLLGVGALFEWGSTRANDEEAIEAANVSVGVAEIRDLVDRIESLEERLAKLEQRESPIRQADTRDEFNVDQPGKLAPVAKPNPLPRGSKSPDAGTVDENDGTRQKTNGQTWRVRLLGHRN